MHFADKHFAEEVDPKLVKPDPEKWGSSYFLEEDAFGGCELRRNYFVTQMTLYSRYFVPFVKNMRFFMIDVSAADEMVDEFEKKMKLEENEEIEAFEKNPELEASDIERSLGFRKLF